MELSHPLVPQLKLLRLSGILDTLERRQQEAIQGQWSYTDFCQGTPRFAQLGDT